MCCDDNGMPTQPDWVKFRLLCPQFADTTKYPDDILDLYWEQVLCIVNDDGYALRGNCRTILLYNLVAHFITVSLQAQRGKQGGFITSSTIDKVSVTKAAPPSPDMFQYWLGQTPYGQLVYTMLDLSTVGGDYVGGLGEIGGFRRAGGVFIPGGFSGGF